MVHKTIASGLYIVCDSEFMGTECGSVFLYRLSDNEYALIGCGIETSIDIILRNILELGVSLKDIRYVVVPYPLHYVVRGCNSLLSISPRILSVAHRNYARYLRQGIDPYTNKSYTPFRISIEVQNKVFNGIEFLFYENTYVGVLLQRLGILIASFHVLSLERIGLDNIFKTRSINRVCIVESSLCYRVSY